jgi:hypothetical protein
MVERDKEFAQVVQQQVHGGPSGMKKPPEGGLAVHNNVKTGACNQCSQLPEFEELETLFPGYWRPAPTSP